MKKHLATFAFMLILVPTSVWASSIAPQTANYSDAYVGLGAGILVPQSTSLNFSGAITASGNINYDDGAAILGMAGYHFNDYLTGEVELGYSSFGYNNISGSITGGALGTGSGSIGVNGNIDALVGLANAIVTPLGRGNEVIPYIGGGLGFASIDATIHSLTFGGTTVADNASDSETDFALDAIVGFDVPVVDGFSVGGRYQYLWVNSGSTTTGGGITAHEGNFGSNIITAQATYNF